MRAVTITALDGPAGVRITDVPEPTPGPDDVVIDVATAGVTFPDVLQTRGEYQISPPLPFVPGSEVAGTIRSAPEGSGYAAGDRVAAFPFLGGFAEVVATNPAFVFPLPDAVGFLPGAALPMNYLTCHFALRHRGGLREGETVLVHGAAGGIGTAAIQLARAWGARVIAVVSSPEKGAVATEAGAHDVVAAEGFRESVAVLTRGRGVDLVVDPVGGDRFTDSLRSLAVGGRLLVIGFTGGSIPQVRVNRLLLTNTSVVGVGWGAYWSSGSGAGGGISFLREQWEDLLPLLASGAVQPLLGSVHPLADASIALTEIAERRATGKVLLHT